MPEYDPPEVFGERPHRAVRRCEPPNPALPGENRFLRLDARWSGEFSFYEIAAGKFKDLLEFPPKIGGGRGFSALAPDRAILRAKQIFRRDRNDLKVFPCRRGVEFFRYREKDFWVLSLRAQQILEELPDSQSIRSALISPTARFFLRQRHCTALWTSFSMSEQPLT
jgi:hypothetical protein